MKLSELLRQLNYFAGEGCLDFDVVLPGPNGPQLLSQKMSVSVAEPSEKLIAIGCESFVLREDIK